MIFSFFGWDPEHPPVHPLLILLTDCFSSYKTVAAAGFVVSAYCWAHVRRRFLKAAITRPSPAVRHWAETWRQRIATLYHFRQGPAKGRARQCRLAGRGSSPAGAAAEGRITAEGLRVLAGDDDGSIALAQMLMKGMDGLKTAEAMWRQAARLGTPPVHPAEAPKIQTMVGFLPVVAVAPKARKGQRARERVAALAIDFEALGA